MISRALRYDGAQMLTGALNAAFVLDGFGRVIALSDPAKELIRNGKCLRIRKGRIEPVLGHEASLAGAVELCVAGSDVTRAPVSVSIIGNDSIRRDLRILPLSRIAADSRIGAAAIVIVEISSSPMASKLCSDFAVLLTNAESEIAVALLEGLSPGEIARRRNVAVATARSQIKSIYAKTAVSNRAEFTVKFLQVHLGKREF